MYDIIIIGKGPAGISAALYTVRANLKTLVLGSGIGGLENAEKIDNYYGFPEGISGKELQQRGVEQVQTLGCDVLDEEVLSVIKDNFFTVRTNKGEYEGKQILLTTGKSRVKTKIKGIDEFLGKGVSMCAVCDGFFYRGKRLVVLGNANYAISETDELTRFSQDITICTNGREPEWENAAPQSVKIDTRTIAEVTGNAKVERLVFGDGDTLELDGIFIAEGTASAFDFAVKMGILTEGTNIVVDENFKTNVDGVFAAGDCIGGFLQVSKAVADGALAARMMIKNARK
ncbi:thioredoxin reductase (NADPH) [Hydrogenoanaerobacterium saccharovorans]|uniref:Thioredoxin reductase (NADPH) n=1 Tax=Hydrogenoanaerobacterium saccharovorans TaxID=474960 RepID=A0A1H7ZG17_9FIRM|nr:FAD-dependent oxidoreductase [Hydrogenoanaerobacterium saccharovorans]RPF48669.1 thioredoxin reductase (NADPH) [Hydrogenoanaerobacterium saccharovorans]SEM56387.1 thioredoxin reductase (NADPH) [Hydrogenoanaerobacterium saccharovorans]